MKIFKLFFLYVILVSSLQVLAQEADVQPIEEDDEFMYTYKLQSACSDIYDPYETLNRKIFYFNGFLDYILLQPIARGYSKATNDYTKARVSNFLSNITTPLSVVNYVLQLKPASAIKSTWRFIINSTLGIGGLFDVASKLGVVEDNSTQTFGNTLARYGVGPGPYLVLPFFGSTNARDVTDTLFMNNTLNPIKYPMNEDFKATISGVKMVHERMSILPFTDQMSNSPDPYTSAKSAIHQAREAQISYPEGFTCPAVSYEK